MHVRGSQLQEGAPRLLAVRASTCCTSAFTARKARGWVGFEDDRRCTGSAAVASYRGDSNTLVRLVVSIGFVPRSALSHQAGSRGTVGHI
mmetsp:Transcript_83027/g.240218  ORF Transcript_83027/g.240218 Transcript_83027/m.240218 type:complete len:90 (+) Transcript_83027:89-358(+)